MSESKLSTRTMATSGLALLMPNSFTGQTHAIGDGADGHSPKPVVSAKLRS